MSQKELAHRLGLKEQQIQRYEANEYATANLERLKEIVEALGIEMQEDLFLSSERFSLEKIFSRSDEEAAANDFADDVMLAGRAEELAEKCVEAAEGKVEWLKRAVLEVAEKEDVEVDALANYMAYRLSLQQLDWWGAASNLQKTDPLPWVIARNILLEYVDLSYLNEFDRDLLMRAIDDGLY